MANNVEEFILLLNDRFTAGMNEAKRATENTESAFGSLTKLVAGLGITAGITMLAKSVVGAGIEAEQTKTSFEVMTGSIGNANKLLGDLAQFANVTPFDNKAVEDSAKIMLQFGIKANDIIPTMKMLGDTSGGNAEKLQQMTLAFSQMTSAGKLQGQDLLQMINAGFNPLNVLAEESAKKLGTDVPTAMMKLRKEMESGNISVGMVRHAFTVATSAGGTFFGMMDKQALTVGGRISTLQGTVYEMSKSIGTALLPVVGYLVDGLQHLVEWTMKNKELIMIVTGAIVGAVAGYQLYILYTSLSAIATGGLTTAFELLNVVMSLNPVGLIIAGIVALIAVVVICYKHFDKFRAVVDGVWSGLKKFFDNAVNTFKALPTLIIDAFKQIPTAIGNVMSGVGKLLTAIVTGDFKSVPTLLKNIGGDLLKSNPLTGVALKLGENLSTGVTDAFKDGKNKSLTASLAKKQADATANATTGATTTNTTDKTKTSGLGSGLSEIKSGAPKVFNINIEKLVEKMSFETANLVETKNIIKDEITKVLLGAVNDSQIIAES